MTTQNAKLFSSLKNKNNMGCNNVKGGHLSQTQNVYVSREGSYGNRSGFQLTQDKKNYSTVVSMQNKCSSPKVSFNY